MAHTVESIKALLATNDKAVGRALMVLRDRQTSDERSAETTKYLNGRGFRPCHARMGCSMANFFERRNFLTPKQVGYWRTPMRCGNTRIEIYARQLLEQAEINAAAKVVKAPDIDVGNQAEAKMVVDEMAAGIANEQEALTNTLLGLKDDYSAALIAGNIAEARNVAQQMRDIEKMLGNQPVAFGNVHPDEIEMMRMESEADLEQTRRDEKNKWRARQAMERF